MNNESAGLHPPQRLHALRVFLRARLSPDGYLGLQLTLGALALICASWMFGAIAEDVATADALTLFDLRVSAWFHAHARPGLTRAMLVLTNLHGPLAVTLLSIAGALWLLWRRQRAWLLALLLSVPGGMLLNAAMKLAFQRARPSFDDPIVTLHTYSFPSGHTAGATLLYGFWAVYLAVRVRSRGLRLLILGGALCMAALVGLSRIYLGVHYLSDVLAAMCEAFAWLALCLTATHTLHARRMARRPPGGP
ncbi:MAG TPA: phosphatase PAP2 family protein [Solimonas sp.]|nr:phosphatase PAP2 family protein [Solimonas sp.]